MYIDNSPLGVWLEEALPVCSSFETAHCSCGHCGEPIVFPIVIRQEHRDAINELLALADKYLEEKGAQQKMLISLMERLRDLRARRLIKLVED